MARKGCTGSTPVLGTIFFKFNKMTETIIAAFLIAYFLQLGVGLMLSSGVNKYWKIGFIIPGIGFFVQLIYLIICMFYIMFDD